MPSTDASHVSDERLRKRQELNDLAKELAPRMRARWHPSEWSEVELTMQQYRALDLLVSGPQRMSEIAAALGTSMQATTSLIDRLVDKGLVERAHDTTDRRVVLCRLSPTGSVEMERVYRIGQARLDSVIDLLTNEELDTVIAAFRILSEAALNRQEAGPAQTPADPNQKVTHEA